MNMTQYDEASKHFPTMKPLGEKSAAENEE
jgi:hypothetical protein